MKTLLVLSKVADEVGVEVPEANVDAEVAQGRERYAGDQRLIAYFESERGRSFIRSTLRRSRVVETIIDEWLAAHPEHPPLPHLEDQPASAVANEQAQANASIGATDPGAIEERSGSSGHDHSDHDHSGHDHDRGDQDRVPAAAESADQPTAAG